MFTSLLAHIVLLGFPSGDELRSLLHLDRNGDPLPFGAVARLGESQWPASNWDNYLPTMFLAVAFSPDGEILAHLKTDGSVRLLDAGTGKEKHRLKLASEAYSMAFAPDTKTLFTGNGQAWDVKTGKESFRLEGIGNDRTKGQDWKRARVLVCAPDGKTVAAAEPESLRIWDATTGKKIQASKTVLKRLHGIAFSPDGKKIAVSGSKENEDLPTSVSLIVLDSENLTESASFKVKDATLCSIVFSADGKRIYASGVGKNICVFDMTSRKETAPIASGEPGILRLAWDEKNKTLAGLGSDGEVRFWDEEEKEKENHYVGVGWNFALSPDGKSVAVLHFPLFLHVLDRITGKHVITRKPRFTLDETRDPISALAFSADAKAIATGTLSSAILWDATNGKELRTVKGFEGAVWALAYAPSGGELAVMDKRSLSWVPEAKGAKPEKWQPFTGRTCEKHGENLAPD
jgi:WD40 repeat protein